MTTTTAPAKVRNSKCLFIYTPVKVRVPALPPVKRKISSNLLNVQIKRRRRIANIPAMKGKDKNQNSAWVMPSISLLHKYQRNRLHTR